MIRFLEKKKDTPRRRYIHVSRFQKISQKMKCVVSRADDLKRMLDLSDVPTKSQGEQVWRLQILQTTKNLGCYKHVN